MFHPSDAPSAWATASLHTWSRRGSIHRPGFRSGRRFVIVHLDGVSRSVLLRAIQKGAMPYLEGLLERGEQVLAPAWSGIPASTPAFQAALFYGDKGDCPGYLWYDKARGKDVRMDDPDEALRLEESLCRHGPGILRGGSIYFSIIAGGANDPAFAMSRMAYGIPFGGKDDEEKNGWDHLATILAHALPFARAGARMAGLALSRSWNSLLWSLQKGSGRHEARYVLNRLLLAELAQEVGNYFTVLDIARGVPAIYSVSAGYDEVAHRRGPDSEEAYGELTVADQSIAMIHAAIQARPELKYELYILSDHGQEATRPVEAVLHGADLAAWILAADPAVPGGAIEPIPGRSATRPTHFHAAPYPSCGRRLHEGGGEENRPPLVVVGAGDLAHVYWTDREGGLELQALEQRWPGTLQAAIDCPASGIVIARGGRAGFAFHKGRRYDLAEAGCLDGVLSYDGEVLRRYLSEMVAMPSAGDLVIFGAGVEGGDVAYAWEFGSHGGVGAGDVETFILHPPWVDPFAFSGKGPEALHHFFRERFLEAPVPDDARRS